MARRQPTVHRRQLMEPQCTHLHMVRLHDADALCCMCHRPGQLGWVYQCTQDYEELIEHDVAKGGFHVFDEIGQTFGSRLSTRKRSPKARWKRFSFLNEIDAAQMALYRPEQVAKILGQRENVRATIQRDVVRKGGSALLHHVRATGSSQHEAKKPWVPGPRDICNYTVCSRCRPSAADRSYLSLNAVLDGEWLPSAAVGFGFHPRGERPVVNAQILQNIGCRPVPLTRYSSIGSMSFESDLSGLEILQHQIANARRHWDTQSNQGVTRELPASQAWVMANATNPDLPGNLKHSPRCDNLAAFPESRVLVPVRGGRSWTPPPSCDCGENEGDSDGVFDVEHAHLDDQLKLASEMHSSDCRSQPDLAIDLPGGLTYLAPAQLGPQQSTTGETTPDDKNASEETHYTTPYESGPDDQLFHDTCEHQSASEEEANGKFKPTPLRVAHGVAVLEESVELGVPDIITSI